MTICASKEVKIPQPQGLADIGLYAITRVTVMQWVTKIAGISIASPLGHRPPGTSLTILNPNYAITLR